MRMKVARVARLVASTAADAWVVTGGSREVLEWFAARAVPAFALFGRRRGLPLAGAGPDKPPAVAAATRALLELGHRRIVLLARSGRRLPQPGASERMFLRTLAEHGIVPGPYNLPDWEETPAGFHLRLADLFRVTPPTRIIIEEARFFFAAQQFFGRHGLQVPEDVSLVCTDGDPYFEWCEPSVAHIAWDTRPVVRRIERWVANLSRGVPDLKQTPTRAKFVRGGTIGPPPEGARS
jgi:DNA-binding LacI/PurR family transcriptional regulator